MYSTSGSFLTWVGFLGYEGGLEASAVSEDNDLASITGADIGASGGPFDYGYKRRFLLPKLMATRAIA
jgi:hypothetical protein